MDDVTSLEDMFSKIASTNAPVKSQQRGEPDLSIQEKVDLLRHMFESSPANFLLRFKSYLTTKDVICMDYLKDDYEVSFHLQEIRRQSNDKRRHVLVRNRRYEAMKQLETKGDYFSFEEMRRRCPLLFEQFVGKYLNERELCGIKRSERPTCLSEFLLDCVDNTHQKIKYLAECQRKETHKELDFTVEEDEDSDEEGQMNVAQSTELQLEIDEDEQLSLSKEEKDMLQQDFLALMQERFLNGEDEDFDYSTVDDNSQYDSLDIREHDEEERYFDAD